MSIHHRPADEINVGDLAMTLGISKQALHRPLQHLIDQDLVCFSRSLERRRFKLLALTEAGLKSGDALSHHDALGKRLKQRFGGLSGRDHGGAYHQRIAAPAADEFEHLWNVWAYKMIPMHEHCPPTPAMKSLPQDSARHAVGSSRDSGQ
jgi:hypothetical protein